MAEIIIGSTDGSSEAYSLYQSLRLPSEYIRSILPKYAKINSMVFYGEYKRNGASLSSSNTDIKMYLAYYDSRDSSVYTFFDRTGVITTSYKPYGATIPAEYINSENTNAGELIGCDAIFTCLSGTLKRTYYYQNRSLTIDYTPPTYNISTYTIGDTVTGAGGTATGGGTFDVTIADQTVTLTATPAEGYRFSNWVDGSGSVGNEPTLTLTISQNNISDFSTTKYYGACFYKLTYAITATAGTGGSVSGGGTYKHGEIATLKATASAGYKFVKWSDGVTTATRTITVTDAAYYIAAFSPICVTYDSIFNFYRWKEKGVTSSRGTVSNITDTGFAFTASVDDAYTDYSHMFKVESGKTYTLEYNYSGGTSHESFVFFHSTNGDYSWTKLASSTATKWNFTVPDGYYLASVRFDVNTNGETISYSNIRIYPADCSYMSSSVASSERLNAASWNIPTPTRDYYKFLGWNTKEDGSGTYYTASSTFPTEDLVLYSVWEVAKIFIGTSQPSKIYLGTQEVKEVYVGTTKVYG